MFYRVYGQCVDLLESELVRQGKATKRLKKIDFAVQEVSPSTIDEVVLGKYFPSDGVVAPRMVVYRKPVESRAETPLEQFRLIYSILVRSLDDVV
ncbi:MAG: hypothetical protein LBQ41_04145 [Candidatus Ancillula sp.]|jgi:hypothetical protein|nr:hypothetical protein [Candidatus Ancillula sp.]